jgi:hypothetical protein
MGQEARSIPFAPIVAMLLFAGGMLVQHQPLQSERPPPNATFLAQGAWGQSVEARLWQDPLEAVRLDRLRRARALRDKDNLAVGPDCEQGHPDCHTPRWLAASIGSAKVEAQRDCEVARAGSAVKSAGNHCESGTLVLTATIFGGPYAEDAEERRRTRYALLAALMANGYEPVNNRGIGYVEFKPGLDLPDVLPFERYRARGDAEHKPPYANVFVLWLTEESLTGSSQIAAPVLGGGFASQCGSNARLVSEVEVDGEAGAPREILGRLFGCLVADAHVTLRVIGPGSTPIAKSLWPDRMVKTTRSDEDCGASVGETCVGRYATGFLAPKLSVAQPAGFREPGLTRFSPTDERLAQILQTELAARGLAVGMSTSCRDADSVALVAEADTHYGRSLVGELVAALRCHGDKSGGEADVDVLNENNAGNVHVYRYFRGLDGNVAQATEDQKKGALAGGMAAKPESTAPQERAQGQSQFDYLLRMASMAEREERFEGRPLRAVVVVGSDVYDKLVVLHAMRERLPGVIFATTDLDAAYLQAEHYPWSRNLIVASGYNFRVASKYALQRGAPPFRDTYQTATFLAVSRALRDRDADDRAVLSECIEPARQEAFEHGGLFEVSDGAFIRLKPADPGDTKPAKAHSGNGGVVRARCAPLADPLFVDEPGVGITTPANPPTDWMQVRTIGVLLVAVLLLLGFAYSLSWCVRRLMTERRLPLVAIGLPLLAYLGLGWWLASLPGEEPFRWLSGVSAWPSEMIRVATIALTVFLWMRGRHHLYHVDSRIGREFFAGAPLPDYGEELAAGGWMSHFVAVRDWVRGRLRAVSRRLSWEQYFPRLHGADDAEKVDVDALWREYVTWISPAAHTARVIIALLCFGLLLAAAIYYDPPLSPVRGPMSRLLDCVTEGAAVFCVILLLVFTLDRVAIGTLFLRRLYGTAEHPRPSSWNDEVLHEFCGVSCPAAVDYVDLQLSVRVTEGIGEIVLYPFVLIVLIFAARSRLFDNWTMPWSAFAVCAFGLGLVVLSALLLRSTAERIRRHAIEQLTVVEVGTTSAAAKMANAQSPENAAGASNKETACTREQIETMRRVAENIREGAFAPLGDQPIVKALLLPFGGAGAVGLLEYLLMAKG